MDIKELNKLKEVDLKKEAKDRTLTLSSWLPILVSILAIIIITLVLGLMTWDFSRVITLSYWCEALVTAVVGTSIFSYSYFNFIQAERSQPGTTYREQAERHHKYQEVVITNQLRDLLLEKAKVENKERLKSAISREMFRFGLSYDDYLTMRSCEDLGVYFDSIVARRRWNSKQEKKFIKAMNNVLDNRIVYDEINVDAILNDKESDKDIITSTQIEESPHYHSRIIETKALKTTIISIVLAVLAWRSIFDTKLLEILVKNVFVIGSNTMTASLKAKSYINYRRIILTNRNNFFANAIPKEYIN